MTAFETAVKTGDLATVRYLIDQGAPINSENPVWGSPACIAAAGGRVKVLALLIAAGADIHRPMRSGPSVLSCAADGPTAEFLLAHDAELNRKQDGDGKTALYHAIVSGKADVARVLLDHGARDIGRTDTPYTALDYAIARCHLETARLALEHHLAKPIVRAGEACPKASAALIEAFASDP